METANSYEDYKSEPMVNFDINTNANVIDPNIQEQSNDQESQIQELPFYLMRAPPRKML